MEAEAIKCVCVGDCAVGKTCLLISYTSNEFPRKVEATIGFNFFKIKRSVDGRPVNLGLWDTCGLDDYRRRRPPAYDNTNMDHLSISLMIMYFQDDHFLLDDLFLICFSIDRPDSLESVKYKWYPGIRSCCPSAPVILVATKIDLRENELGKKSESPVTYDQGLAVAEEINAVKYLECSAKVQKDLRSIFEDTIRAVLVEKQKRKSKCVLF